MVKMSLKDTINQYLSCIEGETESLLPRFFRGLERSGLKFDREFLDRFIRIVSNRISGTYDNFELDATLSLPRNGQKESKKREHNELDDEVVKQKRIRSIGQQRGQTVSDVSSMGNSDLIRWSMERNQMRTSKSMSNDGSIQNMDDLDQARSLDSGIILNDGLAKLPHALKFTCFHCSPEADSKRKCYNDIEAVHTHWIESHWNEDDVAFKFYIIECACDCFYCGVIGTCQEVFDHQKQEHTSEPIIIVAGNSQTCALCTYVGNQMKIHFSIEHEKPYQISLTDDVLNGLLQIRIRNVDGKMLKVKHSKVMIADQIEFVICGCQSKVNPVDYYDHIENHRHDFHCFKCQLKANSLFELVNHDKIRHKIASLNYRCLEFEDRLLKSYMNTKLVFKNGLVVDMPHLMNTKFDIYGKLTEFINVLMAAQKEEYNRMNEETAEINKNDFKAIDMRKFELKELNKHYNDVFIYGIPYNKDENRISIVVKLCKMLNVDVSPKDIIFVSRQSRHPALIARFADHAVKIDVMERQSKITLWSNDFVKNDKFKRKVNIDWMVAPYFKDLNILALKSMKSKRLHSYSWTKYGLFVQRTDNSEGIHVFNESGLLEYMK